MSEREERRGPGGTGGPGMQMGGAKDMKKALGSLAGYCRKYWTVIIIAVLCAAISAVLAVIGPDYISELTAVITAGISFTGVNIDMNEIWRIAWILIAIYVGSMILNYCQSFIMNTVSCRVGNRMRTDISKKINRVPLKYFDTHSFGDTLSRVTNDVDTISQSLHMSIGTLVSAVATLIGCLIMMFVTEWRMALTAIVASLIGFMGMSIIMSRSQKYFNARQKSLAEVNGHVEEYYAGQNIVRAYNSEEKGLAAFRESNEKLRRHTLRAEFLAGLMQPLMGFVGNFGYVAVCIVGAALAFDGQIDFSVVVAFMI